MISLRSGALVREISGVGVSAVALSPKGSFLQTWHRKKEDDPRRTSRARAPRSDSLLASNARDWNTVLR